MEINKLYFLNVCSCGCEDTCLVDNEIVCANCEKKIHIKEN